MSTRLALGVTAALAGLAVASRRGSRSVLPDALPPEVHPRERRRMALALTHGGRLRRFRDEPLAYLSFRSYVEELQGFEEEPDTWVIVGEIPTEVAKAEVMRSLKSGGRQWASFDDYHRWYGRNGEIPDYPFEGRWPSQLMFDEDEEFFWDGWHRFHSYVRSGHSTVPYYALVSPAAGDALCRAGIG